MSKVVFHIFDWCGQHSALLVAIAGFASSVAIAKITSGLTIQRMLCLRRFEAYERAIRQLARKLNVYANIMAAVQSVKEPDSDIGVVKGKVAVLLSFFAELGKIECADEDLAGIVLYSRLPTYDAGPLLKEIARFLVSLNNLSYQLNLPASDAVLKQSIFTFRGSVSQIESLITEEFNHLNAIYVKLSADICRDKAIKRIICS